MLIEQGTKIIVKQMNSSDATVRPNYGIRKKGLLCESKTLTHYLGRISTFMVSMFRKENDLTASSSFPTNH